MKTVETNYKNHNYYKHPKHKDTSQEGINLMPSLDLFYMNIHRIQHSISNPGSSK